MKYAVLADIHANLEALERVLEDIHSFPDVERIICLGDIVGYGANPNECCELIFNEDPICIMGNHDYAAINKEEANLYNTIAYKSAVWTYKHLKEEYKNIFRQFEHNKVISKDCVIMHGALMDRNCYIVDHYTASDNINKLNELYPFFSVYFYGHTHIKKVWELSRLSNNGSNNIAIDVSQDYLTSVSKYYINKDNYYLINPGSLGQPRDGDNRASYLIFDSTELSISYKALAYNIEKTKEKIYRAGLPQYLGDRLVYGV